MLDKLMQKVGRFLPPLFFTLTIIGVFVASPALQAQAQTWVNGFVRDVNGLLIVDCSNCNAGSGVQTVTAGNGTITVGGTATNPTVALNLNNANGYTQLQGFLGSAGNCTNVPTTVYGVCIGQGNGATNVVGIALGPTGVSGWGCVSSCTTSNSAQLCLYGESTTGPLAQCAFADNAGVWNLGKLKITNNLNIGANGITGIFKEGSQSACSGTGSFTGPSTNNADCLVTLSSGAATWTFGGTAYAAAPVPTCTDTTSAAAVKCSASTTAVTISGTGSDVIAVQVMGNGGV